MKTDFLIIGGGVAGLSAAIRLAEAGAEVALLEAASYPAHKICGEFLSPEALPLLQKWQIATAAPISKVQFVLPKKCWTMDLPQSAYTVARYTLEEALAQRARQHGAHIQTNARVDRVELSEGDGQAHVITLASGEQWSAPTLLVGTGRLMSALKGDEPPKLCYVGAKAHYAGIDGANELAMHLMPGAYFGIAPISQKRVNVAGIIACSAEEAQNPKAALAAFFKRSSARTIVDALADGTCLFDEWLVGAVPEFGIRRHQPLRGIYYIGDAAGVIPPATGNGLAMGLTSGVMAAEFALRGEPAAYRARWQKTYAHRIRMGMLLHRLFLSPLLASAMPLASRLFPFLPDYVFRATRGKPLNY